MPFSRQRRIIVTLIALTLLFVGATVNIQTIKEWFFLMRHEDITSSSSSRNLSEIATSSRSAVATLVANTDGDLMDLCLALKSLTRYRIVPPTATVIVFFEEGFGRQRKKLIEECTQNPIRWLNVELSFPEGFDYESSMDDSTRKGRIYKMAGRLGRKHWGYVQMIRFWNTLVWKHPVILEDYDTLMRIDTDSCFVNFGVGSDDYLPDLPEGVVYRSAGPGLGSDVWISGLYDFTVEYMTREGIIPSNPKLWEYIDNTWKEYKTLPVVRTNFEVGRKSFFLREEVVKWHEAVTEQEPYGVFRYRWGDAQIRVLTAALFGTSDEILFASHAGYNHGRGICAQHFNSVLR